MKYLAYLTLFIGFNANADLLNETRTQNVNQSSVHLDCTLKNKTSAQFASYSRVVIKTDFGDDAPQAQAFDHENRLVEDVTMSDFSEHSEQQMRIFVLENFNEKNITNLIVHYKKSGTKITASAVLTTNGKSSPQVVINQEMICQYLGKLAIHD